MTFFGWVLLIVLLAFLIWQVYGLVKDIIKAIKKKKEKKNEHQKSGIEEEIDVVGVYGERTDDN